MPKSLFSGMKIGYRILAVVGTTFAAVAIVLAQFYAVREEQIIRSLAERDSQRQLETVIRSIEAIMLPGQAALAQSYAERLKAVPDVVDFRILRPNGSEAFRDNSTLRQINARLGTEKFPPREREEPARVAAKDQAQLQRAMEPNSRNLVSYEQKFSDGSRVMTYVYAIPSQLACTGCHGSEAPFLGGLTLAVSMDAIDAKVAAAHRGLWIAMALAVLLILGIVWLAIHRSVVRPIHAVTSAMERAAAGNLEQSIPVPGQDELGKMAHSFNVMMERLNQVYSGLKLEQDKLNTVIQSTGEGVVITDGTGAIVLVNDAAVRLLGKRRERIVEEGFFKILDSAKIVQELLARQHGSEPPVPYKVGYKGRTLRVTAATIFAKNGHRVGSAALLRDITPAAQAA